MHILSADILVGESLLYSPPYAWSWFRWSSQEAQAPLVTSVRSSLNRNEWWLGRCVAVALQKCSVEATAHRVPDYYKALTLADLRAGVRAFLPYGGPSRMWQVSDRM